MDASKIGDACMPSAAFPTHPTSARLSFRPVTTADVDLLHTWHSDPRTYTHAPHARHTSREQTASLVERWSSGWSDGEPSYWIASRRDTGEPIGIGGLRRVDHGINLYYRLAAEAHGDGFGTEIARMATALAMEFTASDDVFATIRPVNAASIRTAARAGMTRSTSSSPPEPELPEGDEPSHFFQLPIFTTDSPSGPDQDRLLDLWSAVNADGGAVGFQGAAPRKEVRAALDHHLERGDRLGRLVNRETGALEAVAFWKLSADSRFRHVAVLQRVMTDPALRGLNKGRLLMGGMHRLGCELGIEIAILDYRGGTGVEHFYAQCGYAEAGRIPRGIRLHTGDVDDVRMMRRL